MVCYASLGGSGVVATELARALADRGHEVHLISGVSGAGIEGVLREMAKEIRKRRKPQTAKAIKAAKEKWAP